MVFNVEKLQIIDDKVLILMKNSNEVFYWNCNDSILSSFCCLGSSLEYKERLYSSLARSNDYYVASPFFADKIILVDKNGKTKYYNIPDIPDIFLEYKGKALFVKALSYGNDIYFLGAGYPGIIKYSKEKISVIDNWVKDYLEVEDLSSDKGFFKDGCISKDILYLPFYRKNYVMEFNLQKETYKMHVVSGLTEGFNTVTDYGDYLLLGTKKEGKIILWNKISYESKLIFQYPEASDAENIISNILIYNKAIYIIPWAGNSIYKLCYNENKCERVYIKKHKIYATAIVISSGILFSTESEKKIYFAENGNFKAIKEIGFSEKDYIRYHKHLGSLGKCIYGKNNDHFIAIEERNTDLLDFVNYIKEL